MKTNLFIAVLFGLLLLSGCSKEIIAKPISPQDIKPVQTQTIIEPQPKEPVLPEMIENYILVAETEQSDCDSLEEAGYPGVELCQENQRLQYQDADKIVFVVLSKATKGLEQGKEYIMTNFSDKFELVGNQTIYRIESHELLWFSKSGFDMITIQEGTFKYNSDGGISVSYGKASKDNPVFRRFLADYPAD